MSGCATVSSCRLRIAFGMALYLLTSSCMCQGGWPVHCLCEQVADLGIAGWLKVLVPQAHGIEGFWCLYTHHLVCHRFQLMTHGTGSNRDGDDNLGRLRLTQGHDGSPHGRPSRQAIINQDDRASLHVKRRSAITV